VSHFAGRLAFEAGPDTYIRDIFGLTDIHNATKGNQWVPGFGRTDLRYSLTDFDVLVTPRPSDFGRVIVGDLGVPRGGLLLLPGRWARIGLYVAVVRSAPARATLTRACGCAPVVVDARVVRALEVFDLDALGSATSAGTP
jgi:hypothetical protein